MPAPNLIPAAAVPATGAVLLVNSASGNNATASRNGSPFATLTAAKTAAQPGDVIVVCPGLYAENNLLKNGVNWHFMTGARVVFAQNTTVSIFDDSPLGTNGPVTCVIDGYGEFANNGADMAAPSEFGVLVITNPASNVRMRASKIGIDRDDTNACAVAAKDGFVVVDADEIWAANTGAAVLWMKGEFYCTARKIWTAPAPLSIAYTVWCVEPPGGATANMYLTADLIENTGYGAITFDANSPNYKLWANVKEIRGTRGGVTVANITIGNGKVYLTAEKIFTHGPASGGIFQTGGEAWITAQKMTSDVTGIGDFDASPQHVKMTGGSLQLNVGHFETIGTGKQYGFQLDGGTSLIRGNVARLLNGPAIRHGGGIHTIEGLKIETSNTNNAANHPVELNASGLTLKNCVLVAPPLAESVFSAAAQNLNCYGTFANRPKSANVTVRVQPLTVDPNVS